MEILNATFDFATDERAQSAARSLGDNIALVQRKGSCLVAQGTHADLMAFLKGLRASGAVGGMLHARLQAELTQARPVAAQLQG